MFEKGKQKTGGRKAGQPNVLTRTVKETVLAAFNELQDDPKVKIAQWGKDNPTEFYKIAAKLIPTEVSATVTVEKLKIGYGDKGD